VVKRGCSDDEINLGVGMAGLSALFHQQSVRDVVL
jgi:hypothetical protein